MGFVAALIDAPAGAPGFARCAGTSLLPFAALAVLMLAAKIEGLICIIMAAPIAIPLAVLGAWLAWNIRHRPLRKVTNFGFILLGPTALLFSPHGPDRHIETVTTSIVVNASPAAVWKYVASFPDLGPPEDFLFRAGVAYPLVTKIEGEGVGAARQCVLSTGIMTERVTAWEPGRLLRFEVLSTPAAMHELSPWPDIDPPHLHGFYISKQGEFRLTPLAGGRTLLEGQSWYQHGLTPVSYWNLWAGHIVHRVHLRVLTHIKNLAETELIVRYPDL
jgi:hypothetical protein